MKALFRLRAVGIAACEQNAAPEGRRFVCMLGPYFLARKRSSVVLAAGAILKNPSSFSHA